MKVEVSIGEVIDKLSILEIKYQKILDESKRIEIQKEINELQECQLYKNKYTFLYRLLVYVNTKICEITDIVKQIKIYDSEFANLSNSIFEYNQKRFRIKNWFNLLTSSEIKEQKSYGLTKCVIKINNEESIYDKIAEINYLLLEYDIVIFDTPYIEIIKQLFIVPTYVFIIDYELKIMDIDIHLNIESFHFIQEENNVFEFIPITYISGGAFGDFIHQLSVINEMFYKTGQKGYLYIANGFGGDTFRNGIEYTYNDTYSVLIKQRYIIEYKIYNGETYDINLNEWRNSPSLYNKNWYYIFKETYNVEWGKHKWIIVDNDSFYTDHIFINTTNYRWADNLNFHKLYTLYNSDKIIYIGSDPEQYEFFKNATQIYNIPYIQITSFQEWCILISSCRLIVGSLSAPIAIAHATNTNRICNINTHIDSVMLYGLNKIWDTIQYNI